MIRLNKLIALNKEMVIRLLMVFSLTFFISEVIHAEDKAVKGRGLPDYITKAFGPAVGEYTGNKVEAVKVKALSDIAANYNESNPKWSPTGEIIAYERAVGDNKEIVISSIEGTVLDRLLLDPEGRRKQKKAEDFFLDELNDIDASYNANFSWSPDGKRFVFMSNSSKGDYDIFIGGIKTGLKRIAGHKEKDGLPVWSPAGDRVAFVSGRTGKGDIYIYDLKKEAVSRLTFTDNVDLYPNWSPDGRKIAFTSGNDDNHDICIINDIEKPKESLRCLTEWFFDDLTPVWSPDGTKIAFYSNYHPYDEAGAWSIFVIKADGADSSKGKGLVEKAVASDVIADVEAGPAWSSDSEKIFYVKNAKDEFNPIYAVDIKGKTNHKLNTGTKMNHDVACSKDGVLSFRAQVEQWDHIFIALTNLNMKN